MQTSSFKVNTIRCFVLLIFNLTINLSSYAQTDPKDFVRLLEQARQLSNQSKWTEATPLWMQLTERNPVNGEYWANLANAYYYIKEYDKAIQVYQKQIDLGYGLIASAAYNIACCYSLLKDKEKAITWLQKAFDMGFTKVDMPKTDTDFDFIRNEPGFKKITGTDDVKKMSRTEGWRYDLDFLKQEVMRKSYLRRGLSMEEFNKQFEQLYQSIDQKTDVQIILDMMKMMTAIKDGHTGVFPPARKEFQITLPVQFYQFKEGLYIIAAAPQYRQLLGKKVIGFEKRSTEDVRQILEPYIQRDNDMNLENSLATVMRFTSALHGLNIVNDVSKVELKLQDASGKASTVWINADTTVPRVDHKSVPANWVSFHQTISNPVPLYLKNLKSLYWFEKIPNTKVVYLQMNSIRNDKNESMNAFMDRLFKYINENDADKLVIDLRFNNGGNTMLLPYVVQSIIKNDKINKRGNLYVITGRRTFSAAQNFATFLEQQTNSIFVGEPTGSNPNFVGEEDFITLPYSKVAANVSDLFWQSSTPFDKRTWIAPMFYVPPSFTAYSVNRDEALETILSVVGDGKKSF